MKKKDFSQVKKANVSLVREELWLSERVTRGDMSRKTGLSVATCRTILNEMVETGEVLCLEQIPSGGGRPSRVYGYNRDFTLQIMLYCRMERGEQSVNWVVSDMTGGIKEKDSRILPAVTPDDIGEHISLLIGKYPAIKAAALGIPGVVREGRVGICDMPFLANSDLGSSLTAAFPGLSFTIENDVNAIALGYYSRYRDSIPESLVHVYFPRNGCPGAGLVINGRILRGRSNFAGEIGFLPLGLSQAEQSALQQNNSDFVSYVFKIVQSINSLINPDLIVLSGSCFSREIRTALEGLVDNYAQGEYRPELAFYSDIHGSYREGLHYLTRQMLL